MGYRYEVYDFDFALVSLGVFVIIASNYIFTVFKIIVIYLVVFLHIFLGILGKRWSQNENIIKLFIKYWVYLDDNDKPKNINLCEGACYW